MIRRRHFSWWTKYNYVLSAGLDAGVAIAAVFIFFVLQFPQNGSIGATTVETWWGNSGAFKNTDNSGARRLPIPASGHFGPDHW